MSTQNDSITWAEKKNVKVYPSYLHQSYWYASKTIGSKSSFDALALCMNDKITTLGEQTTSINLSQL